MIAALKRGEDDVGSYLQKHTAKSLFHFIHFFQQDEDLTDQSGQYPEFNAYNWRDTTRFESKDDYRTGCRNVCHCQQQQSYPGLRSPGRSSMYSTFNL